MAFTGGYVVVDMAKPSGKEPFNGELCRSRSTQTSNAVGCSDGVLKKLPRGTKIAVEATSSWCWFVEKARDWDTRFLFL
jgi:hypothetical protein